MGEVSCDYANSLLEQLERAEARIRELEASVPHPGDGTCDRCGRAPAVTIPLCNDCSGHTAAAEWRMFHDEAESKLKTAVHKLGTLRQHLAWALENEHPRACSKLVEAIREALNDG